jgi:hypothetical protein
MVVCHPQVLSAAEEWLGSNCACPSLQAQVAATHLPKAFLAAPRCRYCFSLSDVAEDYATVAAGKLPKPKLGALQVPVSPQYHVREGSAERG